MTIAEVVQKIKLIPIFKDLELATPQKESQGGTIAIPSRTFKDSGKNEYRLGGFYTLFIAHMYPDTKKEFFYLIFSRKANRRTFRCQDFYTIEWNKIFASGYSVDGIIADLESELIDYTLL